MGEEEKHDKPNDAIGHSGKRFQVSVVQRRLTHERDLTRARVRGTRSRFFQFCIAQCWSSEFRLVNTPVDAFFCVSCCSRPLPGVVGSTKTCLPSAVSKQKRKK